MTNQDLKTALQQHHHWLITTHKGPDGDAVGSVVAWAELAKQLNKSYQILFADQPAAFLCPFLEGFNWSVFDAQANYHHDILFALDYNAPSRVGDSMSQLLTNSSAFKVMLDHHPDPDTFCDITVSNVQACSTTEVIYQTLQSIGQVELINEAMAKGLYLGLVTDTGSFRFPSVSAATHQMIAQLFSTGMQHHLIHEAIYDVNSVTRLQLRGYAVAEKLKLFPQKGIGIMSLSKDELARFEYQKGDTEGLVNVILSIEGYQVGVFLMETDEGVKLSFRSKGSRYVNEFARTFFSGGGHKYAAGGFAVGELQSVINELENLLDKL